jgi:hypothetical protein
LGDFISSVRSRVLASAWLRHPAVKASSVSDSLCRSSILGNVLQPLNADAFNRQDDARIFDPQSVPVARITKRATDALRLSNAWHLICKRVHSFVLFVGGAGNNPAPRKPFRRLRLDDPPELGLSTVADGEDVGCVECDGALFHGFSSD